MIKFGSYIDGDWTYWPQFSLGITFWPKNYCSCYNWIIRLDLGFWYIRIWNKSRGDKGQ
jgi:hypothetical protein